MSSAGYDALVDEVIDILPSLTRQQAEQLEMYVSDKDYDTAREYLNFLAKASRHESR
jgi:hypothetical protein